MAPNQQEDNEIFQDKEEDNHLPLTAKSDLSDAETEDEVKEMQGSGWINDLRRNTCQPKKT